jgi:hypothetical protein
MNFDLFREDFSPPRTLFERILCLFCDKLDTFETIEKRYKIIVIVRGSEEICGFRRFIIRWIFK